LELLQKVAGVRFFLRHSVYTGTAVYLSGSEAGTLT